MDKVLNVVNYPAEMSFDVKYYQGCQIVQKLNQVIGKIHESRSNKAFLAIQSPYSSRILNVLNTTDDFPTIKMNISELSLPAVGWQSLISKRVINHYFVLGSWIKIWLRLPNMLMYRFVTCKLKTLDFGRY